MCSLPKTFAVIQTPLPWLELLEISTGIGSNWLSELWSPVSEDWKPERVEAAGRG